MVFKKKTKIISSEEAKKLTQKWVNPFNPHMKSMVLDEDYDIHSFTEEAEYIINNAKSYNARLDMRNVLLWLQHHHK